MTLIKKSELQAIYIMWIRQLKRFVRAKSRIISTIIQPLFFLVFLGLVLNNMINLPASSGNLQFLDFFAPGIIAMGIMFSSMMAGVSVLWDRQFGFLQEVLVAPVSRLSIVVGRTAGGSTTAMIQGFIMLIIAIAVGFKISSLGGLLLGIVFMILMAFIAVGFGLALSSIMKDFQGFQLIMNLVLMPAIFLSTAFFPVEYYPSFLKILVYINPITYCIDGLRNSLTLLSGYPYIILPTSLDLLISIIICLIMMGIGSYLFSKSEV